jgi:hypothetical protein
VATNAQRKAVKEHRRRRSAAGVARFEVSAPAQDKELVRALARRLTAPDAERVRAELQKLAAEAEPRTYGAIWRALRASPLVGAGLEFPRAKEFGRKVEF